MSSEVPIVKAVPVLEVADVGVSIKWYREMLGFSADPFPESALIQVGNDHRLANPEPLKAMLVACER